MLHIFLFRLAHDGAALFPTALASYTEPATLSFPVKATIKLRRSNVLRREYVLPTPMRSLCITPGISNLGARHVAKGTFALSTQNIPVYHPL